MLRIVRILACALLAVFAGGCVMNSLNTITRPAAPERDQQIDGAALAKDAYFIKLENLPVHTKTVLAAVLQKMRKGKETVAGVDFDRNGSHEIGDPYMDYSKYNVQVLEIDFERIRPVDKKTNTVLLRGVFTFANAVGQTFSDQFFIDYTVASGRPIVINSSVTIPLYTDTPTVIGFFVDHAALSSAAPYLATFKDFYLFAALNGIDMFATQEEIQINNKYNELSFIDKIKNVDMLGAPREGEFAFLAFCMDRIGPLGQFSIKSFEGTVGGNLSNAKPEYLMFDDGYAIGMLQGKGKLFSQASPFSIHAYYTKDETVAAPVKVARFTNQKFYGPVSALATPPGGEWIHAKKAGGGQAGTQPVRAQAQAATHPTAGRFLDPQNLDDAKRIQEALKQRGYYKSNVDGLFGKGSLAALRAFRKDTMGQDSAIWDMETQKMLFP